MTSQSNDRPALPHARALPWDKGGWQPDADAAKAIRGFHCYLCGLAGGRDWDEDQKREDALEAAILLKIAQHAFPKVALDEPEWWMSERFADLNLCDTPVEELHETLHRFAGSLRRYAPAPAPWELEVPEDAPDLMDSAPIEYRTER